MNHQVVRVSRRLHELKFGTFNVRLAAFKGVNGIDHIYVLLRISVTKVCGVIGLQDGDLNRRNFGNCGRRASRVLQR